MSKLSLGMILFSLFAIGCTNQSETKNDKPNLSQNRPVKLEECTFKVEGILKEVRITQEGTTLNLEDGTFKFYPFYITHSLIVGKKLKILSRSSEMGFAGGYQQYEQICSIEG